MAATYSWWLRAKINVFPSETGEHYSLGLETSSCSMKLNSYGSKTVPTEDLKAELSLRRVLSSANTALGLHLTGRLKLWLTAGALRPFPSSAWRLMSLSHLSNVTTSLSPKPGELWRKKRRAEMSALCHGWRTLPNSFSALVGFSFRNLSKEREQGIHSISVCLWRGENNYINMIFSRKTPCCEAWFSTLFTASIFTNLSVARTKRNWVLTFTSVAWKNRPSKTSADKCYTHKMV